MNTPEKTFLGSGKFTFVEGATSEATFKTIIDGDEGGAGAVLTPTFDINGGIASIVIEDGGADYTAGSLVITGPGTGAAGTFTVDLDGKITGVTITTGGEGYCVDFGNVLNVSVNSSVEELKHYGSYNGVRRVDRTSITQSELAYTVRLDEIDERVLKVLMCAAPSTNSKAGYTAFEPLKNFNIKGIGVIQIQDVDDDEGAPRFIHEYFGCELKIDGAVDFDPSKWAEASLVITMTNPKGTFYVKD